jgi:hypothetical protein
VRLLNSWRRHGVRCDRSPGRQRCSPDGSAAPPPGQHLTQQRHDDIDAPERHQHLARLCIDAHVCGWAGQLEQEAWEELGCVGLLWSSWLPLQVPPHRVLEVLVHNARDERVADRAAVDVEELAIGRAHGLVRGEDKAGELVAWARHRLCITDALGAELG